MVCSSNEGMKWQIQRILVYKSLYLHCLVCNLMLWNKDFHLVTTANWNIRTFMKCILEKCLNLVKSRILKSNYFVMKRDKYFFHEYFLFQHLFCTFILFLRQIVLPIAHITYHFLKAQRAIKNGLTFQTITKKHWLFRVHHKVSFIKFNSFNR